MTQISSTPLLSRAEAHRRSTIRRAWIVLAIGLLIPFLALWSAYDGWTVRKESPRAGWTLLVLGIAVFGVRMAIYRF